MQRIYGVGFYTAILTTVVTVITFGIAVATPPLSGPFCVGSCFQYPYTDIISRFPRDYLWMYPAILSTMLFMAMVAIIHHYASDEKKIFSRIGLCFALISAAVLITDYFLQLSVIQPSLLGGETDGIALWTQYNPHGVFIVLEEIGFLMMSLAFFCLAPVFSGKNRVETALRWLFAGSIVLTLCSLILISLFYGIHREYRFEVAAITINWTVLIVAGILLSVVFKRAKGVA